MRTPCRNLEINWTAPPKDVSLEDSSVHVWALALEATPEQVSALVSVLSVAESERAEEFRWPQLRTRYIVARASLRHVLGQYLAKPPAQLEFTYSVRGKPALARPDVNLHFNLAHSDVLAVLAVTRLGPVGVDVERVRRMHDAEQIAGRFFSPREAAEFREVPVTERDTAFFNLWTRKEAWLKATGLGISDALNGFEVTFRPEEEPRVRAIAGETSAAATWSLAALAPAHGFVGAVALQAATPRLECWRLPPPALSGTGD